MIADNVLRDLAARGRAALQRGLEDAGELVLAESRKLSPDESGDMDKTAKISTGHLQAAVSYSAPYAPVQHEVMYLRHNQGQAKFLETAALANRAEILRVIGRRVQRDLGLA